MNKIGELRTLLWETHFLKLQLAASFVFRLFYLIVTLLASVELNNYLMKFSIWPQHYEPQLNNFKGRAVPKN